MSAQMFREHRKSDSEAEACRPGPPTRRSAIIGAPNSSTAFRNFSSSTLAVREHGAPALAPLIFLFALTGIFLTTAISSANAAPHQRLFHSGHDGYPRYRIPSLIVTTGGTALAICEGRKDGGGLQGNVDLIQRRSTDGGRTWSRIQRIADAGDDTLGNPCSLLDRTTGFVWLAFTRSPGQFTEAQITAGEVEGSTRVFVTHSKDNGLTWENPSDITATTKRTGWTWYGTGPGNGIQLFDGRLFVPSYHKEGERGTVTRSHSVFSDDHGKTWKLGANAGLGNGESQALQRTDGTIYLSARAARGGPFFRSIVTSPDRGKTWSDKRYDRTLHDPYCQGSLLAISRSTGAPSSRSARPGDSTAIRVEQEFDARISNNASAPSPLWLYCHSAGPDRHNLTIRISRDEGRTWPGKHLLRRGNGQYTSMAILPDGNVGVFYDCWEENNYQLYFARVDIRELQSP